MKIKTAECCGVCYGVQRAIDLALEAAKNSEDKNIFTLGELIHNTTVVENLKAEGILPLKSIEEVPDGSTVIIRSHGVGENVYLRLKEKGVKIIDATCPFVSKIHKIVSENYKKGKNIIIIGEEQHPEVTGINGWCNYSALIFCEESDIELEKEKDYCVVFQTTFPFESFDKIIAKIKKSAKSVDIFNTICYTTKDRQSEAEALAKASDLMLVIGSKHSSNTNKLLKICRQFCPESYLVEFPDEVKKIVNKGNFKSVGITAGASTPRESVREVVNIMAANPMDNIDFDSAKFKAGDRLSVTVIRADEKGIFVTTGSKKDGFIDREECEINVDDYAPANYKEGDVLSVVIVKGDGKNSEFVSLSKKAVDYKKKEQEETEQLIKGGDFEAVVIKAVKSGVLCKKGTATIFVPANHIRIGYVSDLEKYVGKTLKLRLIPPLEKKQEEQTEEVTEAETAENNADTENKDKKRRGRNEFVASQRVILEEEKKKSEDEFWGQIEVGTIVAGKVKRFTDFGAFVSVLGHDCLAHISDLAWYKIKEPAEILSLNETYEFIVLKAERETGKVSLGYKQLQQHPYEIAAQNYPVGSVVKGKVERLFPYGAFVSIDKGIDGLVPISEISHEWVKDASQFLKVGEEVETKIIKFEGTQITLSVKALLPEPEMAEAGEEVSSNSEFSEGNGEKTAKKTTRNFERKSSSKSSKLKADPNELREWTSDTGTTTLGDLLGGLDLPAEEAPEEKPKRKTAAKKKTETESEE